MQKTSLTHLAEGQLAAARGASSGRSSVTMFGAREHDLHADTDAAVLLTVATRA
jgi:hypothetical protein